MRISDDQLGVIISSQIRENGLNDVFDASVVENIKAKLKAEYKRLRSMPDEALLPEADGNVTNPVAGNAFPYDIQADEDHGEVPAVEIQPRPALEVGAQPTDVAYEPKVYTPELPDMLKHVKPAQLVVMELNDVAEGGESLASKPLRMMDNIDVKKSMMDLWKEEGSTKADVYVIKYEKAGELTFDYTNGTSVFIPVHSDPITLDSDGHKENPYAEENPNGPNKFNEPSNEEIENYVKTSVNVEDIVKKVAMELMAKAYQEQNNESAKVKMGMAMPETPVANNEIPAAIYESYQLGQSVKGVEFISSKNGIVRYRYEDRDYIIYDSSVFDKHKA